MPHRIFAVLLFTSAIACAVEVHDPDAPPPDGKSDSSGNFARQPTLHFGQALSTGLEDKRHWHEFYAAATEAAPIDVRFAASNDDADGSVRIVVFGPLIDGVRERIGHAGTSSLTSEVRLDATLTETGKYIVVVARHRDDVSATGDYTLEANCAGGDCSKLDAIASHRTGGLAGLAGPANDEPTNGKLTIELNDGLDDGELVILRAPRFGPQQELATITTKGGVGVFELPADLLDGEDISVRLNGVDDGVRLRVWRETRSGIFLPSTNISDFSHRIGVSGVGVFVEGDIWMVLGSEDRGIILADHVVRAELPGQPGLGFGSFDATFEIPIFDEDGEVDPKGVELLPRDGEILQVAAVSEEPSIFPIGCFQFCNNLGDDEGCIDIVEVECTDGALPVPVP